jgi:hypothetical protein
LPLLSPAPRKPHPRENEVQINGEELRILRWEDAETWVRFKNIAGRSGWAKVGTENIKIARLEF